ncbi:matrixin family metalloprotease [Solirubrobacter phytolaccae]|uniref:Matrixin family metalloprotease n=1 Tax=Solirubrobacter phytolaccae TaxID=1404360 RepID=A0A9X3SFK6_9ACTN|nr:matrixin family metalloprotease [Solirubrobacter phytolaccae]MDA0181592.1 matrixin family metalloprotease [Solirubrobacter phytolaccae]
MLRSALLAVAVVLLAAGPADAYSLGGKKWRSRTITFHANAPQYNEAIGAGVAAWNASGVRVRFKQVSSRRRADVRIITGRQRSGPSGDAHLGYYRRSRVRLNAFDPAGKDPAWLAQQMRIVVVHELGHVLGLKHTKKPCSVMNYGRDAICPKPPVAWQLRCRLLEPDDVRGALKRYGGRAKAYAPEFCDFAPPPLPPEGLAMTYDPAAQAFNLSWVNNPAQPYLFAVQWVVSRDACAAAPTGAGAPTAVGPATGVNPGAGARGNYCVVMWTQDRFGRFAGPASAWVSVP